MTHAQDTGGNRPPVYHQDDPCAQHLEALVRDANAYERTPNMHQVGNLALQGMEATIPLYLGGLGEMHTKLTPADWQNLEIARSLVLQMLQSVEAGTVRLSVYDAGLTQGFADFASLGPKYFNQIAPNNLNGYVDELAARITDMANKGIQAGTRANPREILVIVGDEDMRPEGVAKLNNLVGIGPDWGSVVAVGPPLDEESNWLQTTSPFGLEAQPNPPISSKEIIDVTRGIYEAALAGAISPNLDEILPTDREVWTRSARDGVSFRLGLGETGQPDEFAFDDATPHWFIQGPSGTGKSVAIRDMLTSIATMYSPDEVRFLLLDFKEGAEFVGLGPTKRNPAFLPHADLLGVGVNKDPEFGLAALKWVQQEIERRGDEYKKFDAREYPELREADPENHWPRIIIGIDEFQKILIGKQAGEALALLEDISRRGRAFGIHLLLSTQDISSIQALWTNKVGLFKNVKGRVATNGGSLLNSDNTIALTLPRFHAVVNTNSGMSGSDHIVHVAGGTSKAVDKVIDNLHERNGGSVEPPRVFDGGRLPTIESSPTFRNLKSREMGEPVLLLADEISVKGGSAGMRLTQESGKNAIVVGPRRRETVRTMMTAAESLSKQVVPGSAEFAIVCVDRKMITAAEHTAEELRKQGQEVKIVGPQQAASFLRDTAQDLKKDGREKPGYVFVYGADATNKTMEHPSYVERTISVSDKDQPAVMDEKGKEVARAKKGEIKGYLSDDLKAGAVVGNDAEGKPIVVPFNAKVKDKKPEEGKIILNEQLDSGYASMRQILDEGPEQGVHIIATFSSASKAKEIVAGGNYGSTESVGGYVAFGIQSSAMSAFNPDLVSGVSGDESVSRENRGAFYQRNSGHQPRTVVPYSFPDEDAVFNEEF